MKIKNKILILGLILIALIGIFAPINQTYAQGLTYNCYGPDGSMQYGVATQALCIAPNVWGTAPPTGGGGTCSDSTKTTYATCQPPLIWTTTGGGTPAAANKIYNLLAPLPDGNNGTMSTFDPTGAGGGAIGAYLNLMIKLFIGICAVLAVIMIVMGGIQYMTSELPGNKEAGKERIMHAIFGLLLALGAWTLLNTINPDLLNTELKSLTAVTVEVNEKDIIITRNGQVSAGDGGQINPNSIGTTCDSRTIMSAAQSAGNTITEGQAATFACLITPESGCRSVTNYNWGGGSSAYGPYQILLQTHSDCLDNQACYTAAGVTGPLRCSTGFRNGNPIPGSATAQQCMKAADNFICSTGAAVCVLRKQGFSAWTADSRNAKQAACISKYNH